MKKTLAIVAALCMLVNSCYFNSAGHLFSKVGYKASANSADAQAGRYVYQYGGEYYVELPRYRQGKPVLTQYSAFERDTRVEGPQTTGDVSMFRIPADFAKYLMGKSKYPSKPSYMIPVYNVAQIKSGAAKPIVRNGADSQHEFAYISPNAIWWYTAGAFDWLCVDLPMTLIENSLAITGVILMLPVASVAKNEGVAAPSELLSVNAHGAYELKQSTMTTAENITSTIMRRSPKYITISEKAYMQEYIRAIRMSATRYDELGMPADAKERRNLANTVEKGLLVFPVRK